MLNAGSDTAPAQPMSRFQRLLRLPLVRRLLRYCGASAVSTTIGLLVLATLVATGALTAGWANVVATAVGTGPSFELNRRWVWGRTGRRSVRAEVLPFAALSFASLGVSTLAVSLATGWADRAGLSGPLRVSVALGANLASFGTMWVAQYLLLDRLLFRSRPPSLRRQAEPAAAEFRENSQVATGLFQGRQPKIFTGSDQLEGRPMPERETPRRDARRRSLKRSRTITGALAGGSMLAVTALVGVVAAESGTTHHSASAAATSSSTTATSKSSDSTSTTVQATRTGSSTDSSSTTTPTSSTTKSTSSSSNSSSSSSNNVAPTASSGSASVSSGAS